MRAVVRRVILPLLLVIGGTASLVYGVLYHAVPVLEERETQTTIEIPAGFAVTPDSGTQLGGPSGPPPGNPLGGPPRMVEKTVTQIERITLPESEPALTRDVTVGGVVRLASGEWKRTYDSSSGKGPALCPS